MTRATRRERLMSKILDRKTIPNSHFCIPVFNIPENVGMLIRSAVAFGIENCHIIGNVPSNSELKRISCSCNELIHVHQWSNPNQFIQWARENSISLMSIDKTSTSEPIEAFNSNFLSCGGLCMCLGNETTGVPTEIEANSECTAHIEMYGPNPSINVAVAGSIVFREWAQSYFKAEWLRNN